MMAKTEPNPDCGGDGDNATAMETFTTSQPTPTSEIELLLSKMSSFSEDKTLNTGSTTEVQVQSPTPDVSNSSDADCGSETSKSSFIESSHPLLNDLVLRRLSNYLNFPELKIASSVCSTWEDSMFSDFRAKSIVYADFDQKRSSSSETPEQVADRFTQELSKALDSGRNLSSHFHFSMAKYLDFLPMQVWLATYGAEIESLQLSFDIKDRREGPSSVDPLSPATLESLLTEWCPNLKTLNIPNCQLSTTRPENHRSPAAIAALPKSISLDSLSLGQGIQVNPIHLDIITGMVFDLCKDIKSVRLSKGESHHGGYSYSVTYTSTCRDIFGDIPVPNAGPRYNSNIFKNQPASLRSLECLDLGQYVIQDTAMLRSLMQMEIENLTELRIGSVSASMLKIPNLLDDFLCTFSPRLEKLVLSKRYNSGNQLDIYIGNMKMFKTPSAIRILEIELTKWKFDSVGMLLNFPNLQSLTLTQHGGENNPAFQLQDSPESDLLNSDLAYVKLSSLQNLHLDFIVNPQVVRGIGRCFPNLRKLMLRILQKDIEHTLPRCFRNICKLHELESFQLVIVAEYQRECNCGQDLPNVTNLWEHVFLKHLAISHVVLDLCGRMRAGYPGGSGDGRYQYDARFDGAPLEHLMMRIGDNATTRLVVLLSEPKAPKTVELTGFRIDDAANYKRLKQLETDVGVRVTFSKCKLINGELVTDLV